nr:MAG TPA: hypothetical protein [Caudoviricetes sp.]
MRYIIPVSLVVSAYKGQENMHIRRPRVQLIKGV